MGGVVYYDGQFDDSRLLIHLAMTASHHGATLLNYCPATGLIRDAEIRSQTQAPGPGRDDRGEPAGLHRMW